MKRRLNADHEDDGGLDALLDTMTNVVGILVLVLIVTQLGVADVVSRVVTGSRVDQATLDEAQQQLLRKQEEQQELARILFEPVSIDAERLSAELATQRALVEHQKELLSEKRADSNRFAMRIDQDKQQAVDLQREIEKSTNQLEQLEQLISKSLEQKASLEAMLEDRPRVAQPPAIEVSIPNPRPAPKGSKQLLMVCSNNRLYPVNVDRFRKTAELKAKQLISRYQLLKDPARGIDPQEFAGHFERMRDQDDFFRVEYYVHEDRLPRLRLIPRGNRGGSVKEVSNRRSRVYKKWFVGIDPEKHYGRFIVLPDSFEVYTITRRAFSDAGVLAGWQPVGEKWVYTTSVPGGLVLGPPPEPQPPPAEPPKPKPPAKPPNLID